MFAAERHEHILRTAKSAGRVDVNELADALGVTTETIRRDLSHLQRRGVLRRVHGGAIPAGCLTLAPVGDDRTDSTAAAVRIAEAALDELPDRGSILLPTGEATARLAEMLPADRPLTAVTNALSVASTLVARPCTTVVVVGGRVDRHTAASVESWALHQISQSFVEVAFLEPSGMHRVGTDALVRFGELKDVDAIVADLGIDEQAAKAIAACGPRVLCP